jgi:hypothetical protein
MIMAPKKSAGLHQRQGQVIDKHFQPSRPHHITSGVSISLIHRDAGSSFPKLIYPF